MPAARTRSAGRADPSRPHRSAGLILLAVLLGLVAWSVAALQPPDPAPADAPAGQFSAGRAFAHVEDIATLKF